LLNSRTSLVTVPCNRIHTNTIAGIPYTEDTGLICRIPSIGLDLHTLGYSPRGTCTGSEYEYIGSVLIPFSWTPGLSQTVTRTAHPKFNLILIITILLRFTLVNTPDEMCWPIRKRLETNLCHHAYLYSNGILTVFPFPSLELRVGLGSTNP